jgi:hypothetical protein
MSWTLIIVVEEDFWIKVIKKSSMMVLGFESITFAANSTGEQEHQVISE